MSAFLAVDAILQRFVWVAQALMFFALLAVVWFAFDREPPFAVLSVEPASAKAGEVVTITAKVRRDVNRNCSADFSRYVYASNGVRFDLGQSSSTAQMIRDLDRLTPGGLKVSIVVPEGIQPGPAQLVTYLEYRCNRVHTLWPIETTGSLPFTVLP